VSARIQIGRVVVSGMADPDGLQRALPDELGRALAGVEAGEPVDVRSLSIQLPPGAAGPAQVAEAVTTAVSRTGGKA
jgi:hypothetical protein